MKKIQILLLILLATINSIQAQISFKKTISTYDYQYAWYAEEDDNGNFAILAHGKDSTGFFSNIIKINKYGTFIKDTLIYYYYPNDTTRYKELSDIKYFNNHYYFSGVKGKSAYNDTSYNLPPYDTKIWILKFDTNLNLVGNYSANMPYDKWLWSQEFMIDNDSNIIVYGDYEYLSDTTYMITTYNPFIYKMTLNADSLIYKETGSLSGDVIENADKTGYIIIDNNLTNLDKNLNLINNYYWSNYSNTSPAKVNDDTLMIVGATGSYGNIIVTLIDTLGNIINEKDFSPIKVLTFRSLSQKNGNYFLCGLVSDTFKIYKLNPDLSVVWEKSTGGDFDYEGFSIQATNDGGCIIVGNKFDATTQISGKELDVYIIKIAPDGTIQWKNNITVNNNIKIFPNPGNDFLNITSDKPYKNFILFDMSGKQILNKQSSKQQINTTNLSKGIYFYNIIGNNNKILKTGKWIKK